MSFKYLFVICLSLISCNWVKRKSSETWKATKQEVAEQKKKFAKKGFDAVFGGASVRETTFDEEFTDHPGLKVEHIKGVWMDMPAGYYYCFLEYKADEQTLLRFIESLPTKNEDISDKKFRETTSEQLRENLKFLKTDYPDAYKEIPFFYGLTNREDILYYACGRYPNSHLIAIDQKNGVIYHHFERYAD